MLRIDYVLSGSFEPLSYEVLPVDYSDHHPSSCGFGKVPDELPGKQDAPAETLFPPVLICRQVLSGTIFLLSCGKIQPIVRHDPIPSARGKENASLSPYVGCSFSPAGFLPETSAADAFRSLRAPRFDRIHAADIMPAIEEGIRAYKAGIAKIRALDPAEATFENVVVPLDRADSLLDVPRAVLRLPEIEFRRRLRHPDLWNPRS